MQRRLRIAVVVGLHSGWSVPAGLRLSPPVFCFAKEPAFGGPLGTSRFDAPSGFLLDKCDAGRYLSAMSVKADAISAISELPEDARLEDIMYRLYVLEKIQQGERDVQEGRTISSDAMKKAIQDW